jgi:hypothetical protein
VQLVGPELAAIAVGLVRESVRPRVARQPREDLEPRPEMTDRGLAALPVPPDRVTRPLARPAPAQVLALDLARPIPVPSITTSVIVPVRTARSISSGLPVTRESIALSTSSRMASTGLR